ncbi:hypothetical protein D3C79_744780 [compost metagenome]
MVLVATPISRGSTALWVATSEVGNCRPEAIPVNSMNTPLNQAACGGLKAMPTMANGISRAPPRICGL